MLINSIDRDALRERVRGSKPVPNFCIDGFLEPGFARRVADSYPSYEDAVKVGKEFAAVNEQKKVQVTDPAHFPGPVAELNDALAAPEFTALLSYVFDIPNLLPDAKLEGGGIHQTGPRGHLDVHVDFNYLADRELHRRLNILIYLNDAWDPAWGGNIELWDKDVKTCVQSFTPAFNRCVIFETNEVSYHGVTAVKCPEGRARKSFAAYYYTRETPAHWTGHSHSTIFKARPNEVLKGRVLMPMEKARRWSRTALSRVKKALIG